MKHIALIIFFILTFTGCSIKYSSSKTLQNEEERNNIQNLAQAIQNLSVSVDKKEAKKVALVASLSSQDLANSYQLVTPPLFHNTLINMNLKERGLCYHFAQDIAKELKNLKLKTIDIRWASHKMQEYWEHNALVLTAKNQSFYKGILLDGWRNSGKLYWNHVENDDEYIWREDFQRSRYYGTIKD